MASGTMFLLTVFAIVTTVAAQDYESCPRAVSLRPRSRATCTKPLLPRITFRNVPRSAGPAAVHVMRPDRTLERPRILAPGEMTVYRQICPGFQFYIEATECQKCVRIHFVTPTRTTNQRIFVPPSLCEDDGTATDPPTPPASNKPNIILMMADDIGSRDFGYLGGEVINTPIIDSLAARSLSFLSSWATPLCRTTRSIIMTGKLPFETKWFSHRRPPVDPFKPFGPGIGNLAQAAGYTSLMVGKWQIFGKARGNGGYGFDNYTIWRHSDTESLNSLFEQYDGPLPRELNDWGRYQHPLLARDDKFVDTDPDDFSTNIFLDDTQKFMRQARDKNQSSFVYWPMTLAHTDWNFEEDGMGWVPMPILRGRTNEIIGFQTGKPSYGKMVEYMDKMIGLVIDGLKRDNLYENTIIIFCTDNGSVRSEETRGFKASTNDERGVRVPVIIHGGGGRIKTRSTREMFSLVDMYSTLAGFMGQNDNSRRNSVDFSNFALGRTNRGPRKWSFSYLEDKRMLRTRDWVYDGNQDLYNCKNTTVVEDCIKNPPNTPEVAGVRRKFDAILAELESSGYSDPTVF